MIISRHIQHKFKECFELKCGSLSDCGTNKSCQQPSHLFCQKYVRKREGAVKMCMMVLKMRITCKQTCDRKVCELWFMECTLFCLQR